MPNPSGAKWGVARNGRRAANRAANLVGAPALLAGWRPALLAG